MKNCTNCKGICIKHGKYKEVQRYICKDCKKTFQESYKYQGCKADTNRWIVNLLKEGTGMRSISRLLNISPTTVLSRILSISKSIKKPSVSMGKVYELDEIRTYVGCKENFVWIAYGIRQDTKEVVDFNIGRRTKIMIKPITDLLLLSEAKRIHTDKLNIYKSLIPNAVYRTKQYAINHIERMNLTLRTHLKRLSRKTICFSKRLRFLEASLKILFWG